MTTFRVTELGGEPAPRRVVQIEGELGLADLERLDEVLDEAAVGCRLLVVGLEKCESIDSMALAALLRGRDRLAEDGRSLVIGGATGQVRRVLDISGLDIDGFAFESVEQALGEGRRDPY